MATYKPAAHISDIRGHIQNTTYSRNRLGNFMKIRKGPLDRRTLLQLTQRELMRSLTYDWNNTLDAADRLTWNNLSLLTTMMNSAGIQFHPSGYNLFLRQGLVCASVGETFSHVAPTTAFHTAPTFSFNISNLGWLSIVTDVGWTSAITGTLRFFSSPILNPGRLSWSGPWSVSPLYDIAWIAANLPNCILWRTLGMWFESRLFLLVRGAVADGANWKTTFSQFASIPRS